jgi:hypothetical protein
MRKSGDFFCKVRPKPCQVWAYGKEFHPLISFSHHLLYRRRSIRVSTGRCFFVAKKGGPASFLFFAFFFFLPFSLKIIAFQTRGSFWMDRDGTVLPEVLVFADMSFKQQLQSLFLKKSFFFEKTV